MVPAVLAGPEPHLSTQLLRPFLRLLRERGAPVGDLSYEGVNLDDSDARVPHRLAIMLLQAAVRGTGDEALGLHAAERLVPGDFGVLEYATSNSSTYGEAIATANRFLRLVHDVAEFTLDTDGTTAIWRCHLPPPLAQPPAAAEYFVGIFVVLGRRYADPDELGGTVLFAHPPPRDPREHLRILGDRVRFDQPQNAVILPASALARPILRSDPALKAVLERVADDMLRRLPKADSLTAHVRKLLAAELRAGDPRIEHLAKMLHTTPRTLRRRLDAIGTSHRQILDELRKELAFQYLSERALAVSEVAFLLGYSTPSPFHKAFKRWAGISASEYRKRARA